MMSAGDRTATPTGGAGAEDMPEEGLWAWMLRDTLDRSARRRPPKHLVVLGDKNSGKTALMARFRRREPTNLDAQKGVVLDYAHMEVTVADDDEEPETARLNMWRLDSETGLQAFLQFALTPESLPNALVLIVLDMSRPWSLLQELEAWSKVLTSHIENLNLPPHELHTLRSRMVEFFQRYQEPSTDEAGANAAPKGRETEVLLPLEKGTLSVNLGLPVVVVCNKCDRTEGPDALRDEQYDYIQCRLRKFCLKYGAALVYTSAAADKNCKLLFDYVLHRLYGNAFATAPSVVDKDGVFVPSGWDRESKISIVSSTLRSIHPDDPYDQTIKPPPVRKRGQHEQEIVAKDEQEFLAELARRLEVGTTQEPAQTPEPRPIAPATQPKPAADKSDDMAMAFFNKLLQKSSTAPRKTNPAEGRKGASSVTSGTPPGSASPKAASRAASASPHTGL